MLMWESRHISKEQSVPEWFWDLIEGFWKSVFAASKGERIMPSNNERKNLSILSWFVAEVSLRYFHRILCSGKFFHFSTLWRTDHLEGYVKKNLLWLDLWHFLIQSFKSIAPLLHDCTLDVTSFHLQLSAHVPELLFIGFSIAWRNIWFKMHSPTFVFGNALLVDSVWLETPGVVTKDVWFLLYSQEINLSS